MASLRDRGCIHFFIFISADDIAIHLVLKALDWVDERRDYRADPGNDCYHGPRPARRPIVFVDELKHDLSAYLRDWARASSMQSLADIIAFNAANAERALRFGQDIFLAAEANRGDLGELEYLAARQMDLRASRILGLDAYMDEHRLDAVLFPGTTGASIAAKAGYPSVQIPAGFVAGIRDKDTPDYPYGATFTGRAWSEPVLLRLAYAFEQATLARRPPPGVPPLEPGCPQ
jgi:amidase